MTGVATQQGVFTHIRHMTLLQKYPGFVISKISTMYSLPDLDLRILIQTLIQYISENAK
jgi:hypothetical protein